MTKGLNRSLTRSDIARIAALTDNSGGTASATIAAITDVPTKNAIASLAAKLNAILAAIKA